MAFSGIVLYPENIAKRNIMKLTDKISWLMGRVQKSLFPHLNQCLPTLLTAQEECQVSILEIVRVERHVPRNVRHYRYPGRKPLDRQACAQAFVAKALYRHPTTSDLRRAMQSAVICDRYAGSVLPVISRLIRPCRGPLLSLLSAVLWQVSPRCVGKKQYFAEELVWHISLDSTAIVGREKPGKKVAPEPKKPLRFDG